MSQLESTAGTLNCLAPVFNMGFPVPMQQQLAPVPVPLMNSPMMPFPGGFTATNIRGHQQNRVEQPPQANNCNSTKPHDNKNNNNNNNHFVKNNNSTTNNVGKNNNHNNVAKNNNLPKMNNTNKPTEKLSPEVVKPSPPPPPPVASKSVVSNPSLSKDTNDIKEKLARLKLLNTKSATPPPSNKVNSENDTQDVDPNILSYLKSAVEQNKERKMSCDLSRSSSMRSVCSTIPSNLQVAAIFPENNSLCLIVGNDLIQSSLFIRPLTTTASKEYNEIIDLIHGLGKQCKSLEVYPKEGDTVLYFKDGIYCRAFVVNASVDEIDLFFIDTGEQELNVKLSDLKRFPPEYKKLKQYVFHVKLRNCSGIFGRSAQQYINNLIEDMVQVRLQYLDAICFNSQKQIVNDVVCDLYDSTSNKHINEHLKSLQEEDDC